MHAATLKRVWLDDAGGKVWFRMETFWNTSPVMIQVAPERRAVAVQLVQRVRSVMASYQAG